MCVCVCVCLCLCVCVCVCVSPSHSAQSSRQTSAGLTNFEMLTAAAYLTFSRSVDVAVVEVGVGGLRDATNVVVRPALSVITSIALDHSDLLGATVAEIAREKAGILKPGCPAVVGPVDAAAAEQISEYARRIGAGQLLWSSPATLVETAPSNSEAFASGRHNEQHRRRKWARHSGLEFPLMLGGDYQLCNSAVALDALRLLRAPATAGMEVGSNLDCSDRAIVAGMHAVQWPGRLQWSDWPVGGAASGDSAYGSGAARDSSSQGPVLLDGAHNPAAAEALRTCLHYLNPLSTYQFTIGILHYFDC